MIHEPAPGVMADFSPGDPRNLSELMASVAVWDELPSGTRVLAGPLQMERLGTVVRGTVKFGEPSYVVRFDHGLTSTWRANRVRPYMSGGGD